MLQIQSLKAREILDSRGFPTVEVDLEVQKKDQCVFARASVPSGASTGSYEALELRDQDAKRFQGKGVLKALENIQSIRSQLYERSFSNQESLDLFLKTLDGTESYQHLGANSVLAISMAFCKAQALLEKTPLFQFVSELSGRSVQLPVPMMNILNGGKHADNALDVQEFMIVPCGFSKFSEALRAGVEVFHVLKKILHAKGYHTSVGDEGGYAPEVEGKGAHEKVMGWILEAIEQAGYQPGKNIFLALDVAASELFDQTSQSYRFEGIGVSKTDLLERYSHWIQNYPIVSIEDGFGEEDWEGWKMMTAELGKKIQIIGDDIFVTHPRRLTKGIEQGVANAILIKLNQIGTVTQTLETMRLAFKNHYKTILSHRSGETEESFLADFTVGVRGGQIKTGSGSRTDRMVKYNQLLRIEEQIGEGVTFSGEEPYRTWIHG